MATNFYFTATYRFYYLFYGMILYAIVVKINQLALKIVPTWKASCFENKIEDPILILKNTVIGLVVSKYFIFYAYGS